MGDLISNNDLFNRIDLNGDNTITVEEIYTTRVFHEARIKIFELIENYPRTHADKVVNMDAVIGGLMDAIDRVEAKESQSPTHITGAIQAPLSRDEVELLGNKVLTDFLTLPEKYRFYYKAQLLSLQEEFSGGQDFTEAKKVSEEFLKKAPEVSGSFPRMEICDGQPGLSRSEYRSFEPFLFTGFPVPNPNVASSFNFDARVAQLDVTALKKRVQINDREVKSMTCFILDQLAKSPTGAKLLREVMTKNGEMTIRLMTAEDLKKFQGGAAIGAYFESENAFLISPRIFDAPPQKRIPEDKLLAWVDNFSHELFHAAVSKKGRDSTVAEELLAHQVAQLVTWELGLPLLRAQTRTMVSREAQKDFIWNSYSPFFFAHATEDQIRAREAQFSAPEWEQYIDAQMEKIFSRGHGLCKS